jgi:mono/diheme cytochrome c family protein
MLKGMIVGVLGFIVAGISIACLVIKLGYAPANADATPSWLEKTIAKTALRAVIKREAPTRPNPVVLNDGNLIEGIELYTKNCAVCHGASDGKASNIALGLYQRPPQLAKDGVEDDPEGHTYWKIYHGIRMTGMPSFGHAFTQTQIWQVTLFLKNMESLTPEAQKVWKRVPSQAVTSDD